MKICQTTHRKTTYLSWFRVTLVRENRASFPAAAIRDSRAAAEMLAPHFHSIDREQFVVCGLDAKHHSIGLNVVSVDSLTVSIVYSREVFKPLILRNACALICAHNHPSGDPTPSPKDHALTSRHRLA